MTDQTIEIVPPRSLRACDAGVPGDLVVAPEARVLGVAGHHFAQLEEAARA